MYINPPQGSNGDLSKDEQKCLTLQYYMRTLNIEYLSQVIGTDT